MSPLPTARPANESARCAALHRYHVIDQPPLPDLAGIAHIASMLTGMTAAINLITEDKQIPVAASGYEPAPLPRALGVCEHAVSLGRTLHVPNLAVDERFASHPTVNGELAALRFYLGAPLITPEGLALGTLCVFDRRPHELSVEQIAAIEALAAQVVTVLELRRRTAELEDALTVLQHESTHDALTGVANRRFVHARLEAAIARGERTGARPVVFFCDLDSFKPVNDRYGHETGDQVLAEIGRRFIELARSYDSIGRTGGDEFVVILEEATDAVIGQVTARIEQAITAPIDVPDGSVQVGVSVGVARAQPGENAIGLLARADSHMYSAKRTRLGT